MEKYGVDEKCDTKTAADDDKCVRCGTKLSDVMMTGGIKICPKCGTEPYEEE